MEEKLIEELKKYIKDTIESRLYDKNGGAKYDYANFCVEDDFDWLRSEVENDFEYFMESKAEEFGFEDYEKFEEKCYDYSDFSFLLNTEKKRIQREIDILEKESGTHKIYDHIKNELSNRFNKIEDIFKTLEEELIEKKVVENLEELKEIQSYEKAYKEFILKEKSEENTSEKVNNINEFDSDNKIFKEIYNLIVIKGEGKKSINKKVLRALKDKKLTEEEANYLIELAENEIKRSIEIIKDFEKNEKEKIAKEKIRINRELLQQKAKKVNYDLSTSGFIPKLDFSNFFGTYNAKIYSFSRISDIDIINDKTIHEINMILSEDYMFIEQTIETIKKYTSIINEIGGVLPTLIEEKLDNEVLQDFYDLNLKFYLYISLYYKTLWCDKIQTKWIGKTMDYIKLLKGIIPEKYLKEEPIFSDYIEKNLYPHFVFPLMQKKGLEIFMSARNGEINPKSIFALGIENTNQTELEDNYIISKVHELLELDF